MFKWLWVRIPLLSLWPCPFCIYRDYGTCEPIRASGKIYKDLEKGRSVYSTRFSGSSSLIGGQYISESFFKELKKCRISFEERPFTIGKSKNLSNECQSMYAVTTSLGIVLTCIDDIL